MSDEFLNYKQMGDFIDVIDARIAKANASNQVVGNYAATVASVAVDGFTANCVIAGDTTVLTDLKNKTGVKLVANDEVYLVAPKNDLSNLYIDTSKNGKINVNTVLWNEIDNMDAIALRTDLNWDTIGNKPTDLLNQADLATALTTYVTDGTMTDALKDTLNVGNFNTIITKDYIATMNLEVGKEILMGANATLSWLNVTGTPTLVTAYNQLSGLPTLVTNYSQLTGLPNIPVAYSDAQAVTAWANSGYKTYIGADGVYTGTVLANKIIAGTINGMTINSATINSPTINGSNISVEDVLTIDGASSPNGWAQLDMNNATNSKNASMYSNGTYGFQLEASGGISLYNQNGSDDINFGTKVSMSYPLTISGTTYPQIVGNGSYLQISNQSGNGTGLVIDNSEMRPAITNQYHLGSSTYHFSDVYATNATIQTSDENEKNTIVPLDTVKATNLIMGIETKTYKMNAGTSDRIHWGIVSQDIEALMVKLGMSSQDFAGFIKSPKMQDVITKDDKGNDIHTDMVIPNEFTYGLRYEELIAPIIKIVQCIKIEKDAEIAYLQKQIDDLKLRIG